VNGYYKKYKYLLYESGNGDKHFDELKRYLTEVFDNYVKEATDKFIKRIIDETKQTIKLKLRSIENEKAN